MPTEQNTQVSGVTTSAPSVTADPRGRLTDTLSGLLISAMDRGAVISAGHLRTGRRKSGSGTLPFVTNGTISGARTSGSDSAGDDSRQTAGVADHQDSGGRLQTTRGRQQTMTREDHGSSSDNSSDNTSSGGSGSDGDSG